MDPRELTEKLDEQLELGDKVTYNKTFKEELIFLVNRYSIDSSCNIADYKLASYIINAVRNLQDAVYNES